MGGNRERARKSPKKFNIRSAAKHTSNQAKITCELTSQEEQETIINTQNIMADHSYTIQEQLETQKFEFLKHKI